jgi:hypothetical protein
MPADDAAAPTSLHGAFAKPSRRGVRACITGLQARPELNDTIGTCVRFDRSRQRYAVLLEGGEEIGLKPSSLLRVTFDSSELPGWLEAAGLADHVDAVAQLDLATVLVGGQAGLLGALKDAGVKSLGVRLRIVATLHERLQMPVPPVPAEQPAEISTSTEIVPTNPKDRRICHSGDNAVEAAGKLGIPKDVPWDHALHMMKPQLEQMDEDGSLKELLEVMKMAADDEYEPRYW